MKRQQMMLFLLRRRNNCLKLAILTAMLALTKAKEDTEIPVFRSCRRLQRSKEWWKTVRDYTDKRFKQTFRVSRQTFEFILSQIGHELVREVVTEAPIPPEHRLAVCLYRLARGDYYYTISELTGYGESTVCTIVREVCEAIVKNMWEESVNSHFPRDASEFKEKMLDTEELWQFPYAWAAVDGCHIPIKCPAGGAKSAKEYHNFKNFYSIVLMAMVDAKYRFVWASCGFPGNSHDSIILQSTALWHDLVNHHVISGTGSLVGNVVVPPLILGDSAFPFQPWLMKPYSHSVLSPEQRNFNYRLSRARMVIEGAYGQLKGRWRVLLRKSECHPDETSVVTLACIVLHNACIEKGDMMSKKFDISIDPSTNEKRNREEIRNLLHMLDCKGVKDKGRAAKTIRDALSVKLWNELNENSE